MAKGRVRSPFVPTNFWAALFSPALVVFAVLTCWAAAFSLDFPEDVLDELDWGVIGGGIVVSFVYYRYRLHKTRPTREAFLAPTRVAEAHGMSCETQAAVPALIANAFGTNGGLIRDLLSSIEGGEVRMGTFERHSARGDGGYIQDWGFVALRLAKKLPNIQLLGKGDEPLSRPIESQRLSLEGDFDEHFTLYCPKDYEQDALYLFTPDLMALLVDEAGGFSVQLIDDALVFYSPNPIDYLDDAQVARLFRIVDLVGAKALRGSARYDDDRSDDPAAVAPAGARLVRAVPRWPVLVLWYSANAVLGIAIGVLALGIRLGLDPTQWADRAQQPWLF